MRPHITYVHMPRSVRAGGEGLFLDPGVPVADAERWVGVSLLVVQGKGVHAGLSAR